MRDNVAETLGIRKDQVNIKATTEEGLGFTGSGEGIAAQAAACLETVENYSYEPRLPEDGGQPGDGCATCSGCPRAKEG